MALSSVALIQTPCYELENDRLEPPLGLLYLATWLDRHGYPVQIVDLASMPPETWADAIPRADVYGFSTYTTTYHRTLQVLNLVKEVYPDACTVAGGPHASALPYEVARDFEYVVVGEGEAALLDLLRALDRGETPPRVIAGAPIEDLDTLPIPDYSLVDISSYSRVVAGLPCLSVLSSRGCPYQCVFCNSIIMGSGRRVRLRSAGHVIREIRRLKADWGVQSFRFQDDTFTISLARLKELTAALRDEQIVYRCFGRVNLCTPEMAATLREGGCQHIAFGIESGSDDILRRMKKGQTVADIRRGIASAKAAGLIVRIYLIVGFPGETWQTIEETINLMLECAPDEFSVYPLIPYPGTPLYETPERFGITEINPDFRQYFQVRRSRGTGYVYRTVDLDERIVADMRAYVIDRLEPAITWAGESRKFK
jgi:radical SAM superfamily enzyme YgiQ (UPF0313 family)